MAAAAGLRASAAQAQASIPQTDGWLLVVSRCVICHSVEIAVQQRQGPHGWGLIIDRMVSYGMPLQPDERRTLIAYLVRHFGDPEGR
jgi:cytochrome c2